MRSILSNEKYTGNAVLGKTFKPDVLSKKRQINDGKKAPQYYVEDTHPAIIESEIFQMVKKELARRQDAKEDAVGSSRYTSKYPFSGLLICGNDGTKLRRHVRTMGTGEKVASWACARKITQGTSVCDLPHIREDVMQRTYLVGIRLIVEQGSDVVTVVRNGATKTLETENSEMLANIDAKIIDIQESVLELHKKKQHMEVSEADYSVQVQEQSKLMKELEAQRNEVQDSAIKYVEIRTWIQTFENSMQNGTIMTAEDGSIMKTLVDRIIVCETGIEIHFKCGVTIQQEYEQ